MAVVLRGERGGASLTEEPVTSADLADVLSEAWLEMCLRKGWPQLPLAEAPMRLLPTLKGDLDRRCYGFELEATLPDGRRHRCSFSIYSLGHVASRAARRLIDSGALPDGQTYFYEVVRDGAPKPSATTPTPPDPFHLTIKTPPLTYLTVPLRVLLEQAKAVDILEKDDLVPVFYTADALGKAESLARRGGQAVRPVETGAMLIGSLCSCPDTGEFFVVVADALEVMDAEEAEFSLVYSSRSWTRLLAVMKARQAAHPLRAERLLGQTHGHNYTPNDGKVCEACPQRAVCNLTNVFASLDDQLWSAAVFSRQPWQLCHIFGLSARGDKVHGLFGLQDGRLQQRGFFKLPNFDPDQWQTSPPTQEKASYAKT